MVKGNYKRAELVIPKITKEQFIKLSAEQQKEYLRLYREQVSPKFEEWRKPAPVKIAYGGRGAGAKSESTASLLIQFAEHPDYFGENIKVICLRSVQKSIKDSSYSLLCRKIDELGYTDFEITQNYIRNKTNGSYFTFNGLNDFTSSQLKSLDAYTIAFIEEADGISLETWNTLEATIRKEWYYKGEKHQAEIWAVYNPNTTNDPITQKFVSNPKDNWLITKCEPLAEDNPFYPDNLLEKYEDLLEIRQETQALLFDVLQEIDQHGLAGIDVDYEKLGRNRQAEADNIAEEVNVVTEYKTAFDEGLALISSGAAEQAILDAENSW